MVTSAPKIYRKVSLPDFKVGRKLFFWGKVFLLYFWDVAQVLIIFQSVL